MPVFTILMDRTQIRKWVESRHGTPALLRLKDGLCQQEILKIAFEGDPKRDLEPVSWWEWFTIFEENHLAFVCEAGSGKNRASCRRFTLVHRPGFHPPRLVRLRSSGRRTSSLKSISNAVRVRRRLDS